VKRKTSGSPAQPNRHNTHVRVKAAFCTVQDPTYHERATGTSLWPYLCCFWNSSFSDAFAKQLLTPIILVGCVKDYRHASCPTGRLPEWNSATSDRMDLCEYIVYIYIFGLITKICRYQFYLVGRDSSVGIATMLRVEWSRDRIPVAGEILFTLSDRDSGPPSVLYNRYKVSFPWVKDSGLR